MFIGFAPKTVILNIVFHGHTFCIGDIIQFYILLGDTYKRTRTESVEKSPLSIWPKFGMVIDVLVLNNV